MRRGKRRFSFLWGILAAITVFLLFPMLMPQEKIMFSNENGKITLMHVNTTAVKKEADYSRSFLISAVTDIRFLAEDEIRTEVQNAAIETKNCLAGKGTDARLGRYDLLVYKKVPNYVWIGVSDEDGILMNLADTRMTESFYEALDRYMEGSGQESEEGK